MAARWWASRDDALDWLSRTMNVDLSRPQLGDVLDAWRSLGTWAPTAQGAEQRELPLWWCERAVDEYTETPYSPAVAVGVDAMAHLYAHWLKALTPALRFYLPEARQPQPNEPSMGFDPDGKHELNGYAFLEGALKHGRALLGHHRDPSVFEGTLQEAANKFSTQAEFRGFSVDQGPGSVQPQEAAPPFDVEKSEAERNMWVLGIEENVAHDEEELVERLVTWLQARRGMRSVEHTDREIIMIEMSRGSVKKLESLLEQGMTELGFGHYVAQ